ncbi:sugar phosphate isomerase/epimerase family protein [Streptantibioticus silvisoli]|uniref:Sugar phosphate isomerase/epimerase family protein n=1 Tax=Streptantibioticus silvisoli TaxID=2705255 RepID=A0ABT6WB46_9ACTN|nr:sugar phosphate isomerase/epimerase family protein [Streptantibioticus silvisoli]MDI5967700.1 sugar phosphate isomerase/epimerase family protein [Streptantibioticus silvisoli]
MGITAVGLWREPVQAFGVERTARTLRAAGLTVSSLCRGGFLTAVDPTARAAALADNRAAIDEAAALGTPTLVLVSGGLPGAGPAGAVGGASGGNVRAAFGPAGPGVDPAGPSAGPSDSSPDPAAAKNAAPATAENADPTAPSAHPATPSAHPATPSAHPATPSAGPLPSPVPTSSPPTSPSPFFDSRSDPASRSRLDPARDLAGARERVADGLAELAPYAAERGVRLALEPLHPMFASDRCVISTLEQALDLAERFPADQVGVVVDTYHLWWDDRAPAQVARAGAGGRIAAFQLADWTTPLPEGVLLGRGQLGDGCVDLRGWREKVEAAGYRGHVEVEIFNPRLWERDGREVLAEVADRFRTFVL